MKYHNGKFYILINGNDTGGWLLSATDPEGKWSAKKLSRTYYDPGMLFDNGKVYVACGIGNIQMCELDEDFNFIQEKNVISDKQGLEGCHLYKIGDYYYIYATYGGWPSGQAVFRSNNIFGPYEEKMLVEKIINDKPNTVHQGALFDTPDGSWWTIMQQDLGALGRMPNMQPVKWSDGWPVVGNKGVPYTSFTKPSTGFFSPKSPLPTNDNFRSYPLGMQWQWNHNPNDGAWSLFDRAGWMRLYTSETVNKLHQAQNMLTQRIFAYTNKPSKGTICLDTKNLHEGNIAGICVFQDPYAMIGVRVRNGKREIVWQQDKLRESTDLQPAETTIKLPDDEGDIIYLRATINYSTSKTQFYYSLDNTTYTPLGGETTLGFNLNVFVGARFGLFCYATEEGQDGYADFDWFSTEEQFDEATFYPENFEGFNKEMLTAKSLTLANNDMEIMIGNNTDLQLTATFQDGHTENVAAKAHYNFHGNNISINNGMIRGLSEGTTTIDISYTDPLGNELTQTMNVKSTFFPFGAQYINTSLFAQGTYNEKTHTFRPGQWGQMGWEYPNGADMSAYKYLVIKLKQTQSCDAHLNMFTTNSIWNDCYSSASFGTKKQIVINLQTAKYTSGDKQGKALETNNIHIVSFWTNGTGNLIVDDMYLTNNEDYSPMTGISDTPIDMENVNVYTLTGIMVKQHVSPKEATHDLPSGIYIIGNKKVMAR